MKKLITTFILLSLTLSLPIKAYWVQVISPATETTEVSVGIGEWAVFRYDLDAWVGPKYINEDGTYFVIPAGSEFIYKRTTYRATKDFKPMRPSNMNFLIRTDPLNLFRGFERV